mgnify:CR=1 FL=1
MKIVDKQIVGIFIISVLLVVFLGMFFCFSSCKYAPPIIVVIMHLLSVINVLCLLYFLYKFINWFTRFGKKKKRKIL